MPTSLCFRSLRAAATLALAAAAACLTKDERSDLVLTKLVQPTAAAGCVLDPSSAESSHIRVDLTSAPEFAVGAVVENRLANNANVLTGRLNSNDFISRQARLHFEFPDSSYGGASIGDLIVPVSGVVPAAGRSALDIPALPYAAIQTLKAVALPASGLGTVRVLVHVEGKLLDGSSVQTSQYEYVFGVCASPSQICPTPTCPAGTTFVPGCTPGVNADPGSCL